MIILAKWRLIKSCEEPGIYAIAYWMKQHCDIYENSVLYPYSIGFKFGMIKKISI